MKVTAKFKGKKPSLGYMPGKEYTLIFNAGNGGINIFDLSRLDASSGGAGSCPYTSLKSFLDNWEVIR